jgi:SAM-dependent methyltransferase
VFADDDEDGMTTHLGAIYSARFDDADAAAKDGLWQEITRYLQRYVPETATVLDIACDRGYFIRNISAGERWAADLSDVSRFVGDETKFIQSDGLRLDELVPNDYFDVVFMSNYLEHLRSRDDVIRQLEVARKVLRPGGRVVVLQPNIRLTGPAYWDFIDHHTALTEQSLVEAAELAGLTTTDLITRFLPYTTKSRVPQHRLLVRAYLNFPPLWRLLGQQTLYVGQRPLRPTA